MATSTCRRERELGAPARTPAGHPGCQPHEEQHKRHASKAQVRLQGRALAAVAILICRLQGQRGVNRPAPPDAATTRTGATIPLATGLRAARFSGVGTWPRHTFSARAGRSYPHQEVARGDDIQVRWVSSDDLLKATPVLCAVVEVDEASRAYHHTEMREATANRGRLGRGGVPGGARRRQCLDEEEQPEVRRRHSSAGDQAQGGARVSLACL